MNVLSPHPCLCQPNTTLLVNWRVFYVRPWWKMNSCGQLMSMVNSTKKMSSILKRLNPWQRHRWQRTEWKGQSSSRFLSCSSSLRCWWHLFYLHQQKAWQWNLSCSSQLFLLLLITCWLLRGRLRSQGPAHGKIENHPIIGKKTRWNFEKQEARSSRYPLDMI